MAGKCLIGVRVYKDKVLENTRYFVIGNLKDAVEYAKHMGSALYTYEYILCDSYGNYICDL